MRLYFWFYLFNVLIIGLASIMKKPLVLEPAPLWFGILAVVGGVVMAGAEIWTFVRYIKKAMAKGKNVA